MMKFTMLILRRRGFASQEAESAPSLNTRLTCPLVSGSAWIVSNALRHTRAALLSLSGTGRTAGLRNAALAGAEPVDSDLV